MRMILHKEIHPQSGVAMSKAFGVGRDFWMLYYATKMFEAHMNLTYSSLIQLL